MSRTRQSSSETARRLASELEQGRRIAHHAEEVWGYGSPAGILRARRRADLHIQYGRIDSTTRVLELGSGTGTISRCIAPSAARLTVTDLSRELLQEGRRLLDSPNVVFLVTNAEELPFETGSFDAVIGNAVLHHLDVGRALEETRRVLKPGGRIVFTEPNMLNPQIVMQKNWGWLKERLGDTPDESAFLSWQVRGLLSKHGYVDVSVCPFDFLHPATPKALIPFLQSLAWSFERLPLVKEIAGSLLIAGRRL